MTYTAKSRAKRKAYKARIRPHKPHSRVYNAKATPNPLQADPSLTGGLRAKFLRQLATRFRAVQRAIYQLIAVEDALGLRASRPIPTFNAKFSSVQANLLQEDVTNEIKRLQSRLEPDDILKLETQPHITIRYGLHTLSPSKVALVVKETGNLLATVGKLSLFITEEADVLKFDVTGNKLNELHDRLGLLEHTDTHKEYKPHLTIAYLKPGTGAKYLSHWSTLQGRILLLDKVTFSTPERDQTELTLNQRWRFRTNAEKIQLFQIWLQQQLSEKVLEQNKPFDDAYWQAYVEEGYRKGAGRAFDQVRKAGLFRDKKNLDFYQGSKEEFLRSSFGRPESVEKVKLLAGRTLTDLKGVTDDISVRLSRILTDGLVQGQNPITIGRAISNQLGFERYRADRIARTEIIRAHAEGRLDSMERLGARRIAVMVEWTTASDSRVCPQCQPLSGVVLTIKEARGLIPRHPNCRCAFLPANLGESTKGQQRGKHRIQEAIKKSVLAEGGRSKSIKEKLKRSKWVGAGKTIEKVRPTGILAKK